MISRNSSNPFFSERRFLKGAQTLTDGQVMTIRGTLNKFGFLIILLLSSAAFTWSMFQQGVAIQGYVIGAAIVGLVVAVVISFNPKLASYIAPLYALIQGVVVGGISALFSFSYGSINEHIVLQASFLTIGVVLAMFLLYRFRIIRVTQRVRSMIFGAVMGVFIFYMLSWVLSIFGVAMPLLTSNGPWGIGISVVIVLIAAFCLLLDFDMIERGASHGIPKYMEWFSAFGLLVTIVWIYIEVLKLVARITSSRD